MVFTVRLLQHGIQSKKKKNIYRYAAFVRHHNNAYIMQNDTVCMRHGTYCHQWLFYVVTGRFCSTAYLVRPMHLLLKCSRHFNACLYCSKPLTDQVATLNGDLKGSNGPLNIEPPARWWSFKNYKINLKKTEVN